MDPRIEAAKLLGRWTLISERHGGGCSCCPGLGDVGMEEVERRVLAWLRERHAFPGDSLSAFLKDCIRGKPGGEGVFADLEEALGDLERMQSGMPW